MTFGGFDGKVRRVFILDSRDWFASCRALFDPASDVVLTYDLALKLEIEGMGGRAFYVDHLVDAKTMQANNFLAYDFFRKWHFDADGHDIFTYGGVPFGFSFRIEFWNDFIFYIRARLCLEKLAAQDFESLYAGTKLGLAESILDEMGQKYIAVERDKSANRPSYYFPIHEWMTENIRKPGLRAYSLKLLTWFLGSTLSWCDRVLWPKSRKPAIYMHHYHPTQGLIRELRRQGRINIVGGAISKNLLRSPRDLARSRFIPLWGSSRRFRPVAEDFLERFRAGKCAQLVLSNGSNVSDAVYALIERKIAGRLPETLRILDCVRRYFEKSQVQLEVMVSNIGEELSLVDAVCKTRGIPSYLIINGWMSGAFLDEGKYATTINAYSTSIKEHYFRGMENVVCLGDPRMDAYPPEARRRRPEKRFTVTIGVSGHSPIDLNSYVALEFEFIKDVLQALSECRERGMEIRIVIKVRPNSYVSQYRNFVEEYFTGLVDEYIENVPMRAVLQRTDLYISIFSQTHFEASCLGIPCVYYKNDKEELDPPFDGTSELVTARCVDELVQAILDFAAGHQRFEAFLDRAVMEKYIGYLDGGNVSRNLAFVHKMMNMTEIENVA